jgi:hypothetical protein
VLPEKAHFLRLSSQWQNGIRRTVTGQGKVAAKALARFKQRIWQLPRRSDGRGMAEVIERLRACLRGWKAYCGLSQTPGIWRSPDEWLRHRLRAIQLNIACFDRLGVPRLS